MCEATNQMWILVSPEGLWCKGLRGRLADPICWKCFFIKYLFIHNCQCSIHNTFLPTIFAFKEHISSNWLRKVILIGIFTCIVGICWYFLHALLILVGIFTYLLGIYWYILHALLIFVGIFTCLVGIFCIPCWYLLIFLHALLVLVL